MNRNYVYAFPSVHGTCNVVNYSAESNDVNSFISLFNIFGNHGNFKISNDGNHQEVWFESSMDFYNMLQTETMKRAFRRMGVQVVFEYPFEEELNNG